MKQLVLFLLPFLPVASAFASTPEKQIFELNRALSRPLPVLISQDLKDKMNTAADENAAVEDRIEAIKSLRSDALRHEKVMELLEKLSVSDATTEIRIRAVQSLGYVVGQSGHRYFDRAIKSIVEAMKAARAGEESVLVMGIKALHWSATVKTDQGKRMMEGFLKIAKDDTIDGNFRVAAIWSLASVSEKPEVYDALTALLENPKESAAVRLQALKSLYPYSGKKNLWTLAINEAKDEKQDLKLREAAVLFLWAVKVDEPEVRKALGELAGSDEDRVREAVKKAQDPAGSRFIFEFFRLRYDKIRHLPIEVLELE